MNDVSDNNESIEEDQEEYEEINESTEYPHDTVDYSSYFENLQAIGILIMTVILGSALAICFLKGFRK